MWRDDQSVVVRVVPDRKPPIAGWNVFNADDALLARITPTERPSWRGKVLPIGARPPLDWEGRVSIDGQIVALIADGRIVHLKSGDRITALSQRIERRPWSMIAHMWDLDLSGSPPEPWRAIALGWLGVAWFLQRAVEPDD
jgi:hypothetical protein